MDEDKNQAINVECVAEQRMADRMAEHLECTERDLNRVL